ncbi:hypothetical protein BDF19DRAFT_413030 [Syncephalis fuscata]|nr:hypothetical protein BDF19DRAFT_413030 [Syncephalis fuscata]
MKFLNIFFIISCCSAAVYATPTLSSDARTSYALFLNNYRQETLPQAIPDLKKFLATDKFISSAAAGTVDENLVTLAQLRYQVQHTSSVVLSYTELGILKEWLDTRENQPATAQANEVLKTLQKLYFGLDSVDSSRTFTALVNGHIELEGLYTKKPMGFWTIQEFISFLQYPAIKPAGLIASLIETGEDILNDKQSIDLPSSLHKLDVHASGLATLLKERTEITRLAKEIHSFILTSPNIEQIRSKLHSWIALLKQLNK